MDVDAKIAALAAQLEALRAENAALRSGLSRGSIAPSHGPAAAAGTPSGISTSYTASLPVKSYGEVKLWVGTWNMGADDPFHSTSTAESLARLLNCFIPKSYDIYVLGVQEALSDRVFDAVEVYTETFRLPLHLKLYPARESDELKLRSRRLGRAIAVSSLMEDASRGVVPDPVPTSTDMLDRVWGRGDGALLTPKFTGIACFVAPVVAPYTRLLGVYKHSFGASEGSKGGVGLALGVYDATLAFINCHMASKRSDLRWAQYSELVDRLGAKLGGRGFALNESFHHVVWMGDLNTHISGVSVEEALGALRSGRGLELLLLHDELLMDKAEGRAWFEYEEPLMDSAFYPTYKKRSHRGRVSYSDPDWPARVYISSFKEPFYKGGRVVPRIPSWTDRIQYHSLPSRAHGLQPEVVAGGHNYHAVNEGLDGSDHSPVYATFTLAITAEESDGRLDAAVEALQVATGGYGDDEDGASSTGGGGGHHFSPHPSTSLIMSDAAFTALHPSQRPLVVVLHVSHILVDTSSGMRSPRAVSVLFPLPYEDSNEIPVRAKIVRSGTLFTFGGSASASETRDGISATVRTVVSRASKLESLHMLLKVSLDDNTKAQTVVCMRDGGFVREGSHMNVFLQPLTAAGVPLKSASGDGRVVNVQFQLDMNAYARGGAQSSALMAPPIAAPAVAATPTAPASALAMRRALMSGATAAAAHGAVTPADPSTAARLRAAEMMATARARASAAATHGTPGRGGHVQYGGGGAGPQTQHRGGGGGVLIDLED